MRSASYWTSDRLRTNAMGDSWRASRDSWILLKGYGTALPITEGFGNLFGRISTKQQRSCERK